MLLNGIFIEPLAWIFLRVGSGFFLAGAFMIIESWLNERASNESRGTIFAVYLTVTYLSITLGQLGVGAGDPLTTTLFMTGAILFSVAVLPTALSTAASPRPLTRVRIDLRKLYSNSPVAFLTVLLVGIVNGAFGTLAAVWGARIGLSTPLIALMMAHHHRQRRRHAGAGRPLLRQDRPPLRHRRRGCRRRPGGACHLRR